VSLEHALERNRADIESGIAEAEREIGALRERIEELQRLIARGRAALGESSPSADSLGGLTLHEALEVVLMANRNHWTSVKELAREVNQRGLYRMRDGRPVEPGQVHARVRNYKYLFEKKGQAVRLGYAYATSLLDSSGAYWAAITEIKKATGERPMEVVTQLAYSVGAPEGQAPEEYVQTLSDGLARQKVRDGGFEAGARHVARLTTTGWQDIEE